MDNAQRRHAEYCASSIAAARQSDQNPVPGQQISTTFIMVAIRSGAQYIVRDFTRYCRHAEFRTAFRRRPGANQSLNEQYDTKWQCYR